MGDEAPMSKTASGLSRTSLGLALPETPKLVTVAQAKTLERKIAQTIADITDLAEADEGRRRADALEAYTVGTEAHPYAQGIARRMEARVGELLGAAPGKGGNHHDDSRIKHPQLRKDFRTLAHKVRRGLKYEEDGEDSPWRSSRRALLWYDPTSLGGLKESVHVEWYTPEPYIKAARKVMGSIDLDPASSEMANETVKADTYFTQDDEPDGLSQDWFGTIWLNPPYGKGSGLFTTKLVEEHTEGRVRAAVLLLNAYGFDAEWFQPLWAHPICFTDHRIRFYSPQRESGGPANGNIFVYFGGAETRFAKVFSAFGQVVRSWP